ncbi:MAG TPA: DUF4402 domain-containing protein [Lentimicrobium sp.]|jgi:hypothetical protein|nr:DUF4402 domain-containing protein [Lentimicrobium sp.]
MNRKITAITLLLLAVALKGWSQSSVTGQAYAEVIAALSAYENSQMNFGKFSPEVSGGQIVLTPDGVRSAQGSVVLGGGTAQAGKFIITGQANATFTIQLPVGPSMLTNGSNNTMTIDNWVSNPPAGIGTGILTGGTETVSIGATLTVGSFENNPVGIYTGTYSLTFAYN